MKLIKLSFALLSIIFCYSSVVNAQIYEDYFGTGNTVGLSVSSSSSTTNNEGITSLTGTDLIPDQYGAARFLSQASLGYTENDINYISNIGIENWIDEQINLSYTKYKTTYRNIFDSAVSRIAAVHGIAIADSTRRKDYMSFSFYEKAIKENDLLRQKVAFALSQIFVVSLNNNELDDRGFGISSYYDLLYDGAFGNFRDLLYDVSLHPIMGLYLSHFKNQKADPDTGVLPDENYAREIMQLFTIGLFELNNDGSLKLDNSGEPIPTYDIVDVQELAKVFTGLSGGDWDYLYHPEYSPSDPLVFHKNFNHYDMTVPMMMHEDYHDPYTKVMIDGTVIPAGQAGMDDINQAIDILFNHDNVGPFIALRLIQQLVKSNPSPAYINRVALAFNNDGNGVRGNLEYVIRTILTDTEARNCNWLDDAKNGKLLQPVERIVHLFKALNISSPSGEFWYRDFNEVYGKIEHSFLYAPSVFNFYSPFYAEKEFVAPNNMYSPEFQILHSTSGIHQININEDMLNVRPFKNRTGVNASIPRLTNDNADYPVFDFSTLENEYNTNGISGLIEKVNLLLCRGQLSTSTIDILTDTHDQLMANNSNTTADTIVRTTLYFILMSPNYVILK